MHEDEVIYCQCGAAEVTLKLAVYLHDIEQCIISTEDVLPSQPFEF